VIVCLCEGLSERVIEQAVRDGATTVRAVARSTGAGTGCGSCVCDVRRILDQARGSAAAPRPEAALAAK
jgi:bacterioferritin-associated ferredoxin